MFLTKTLEFDLPKETIGYIVIVKEVPNTDAYYSKFNRGFFNDKIFFYIPPIFTNKYSMYAIS